MTFARGVDLVEANLAAARPRRGQPPRTDGKYAPEQRPTIPTLVVQLLKHHDRALGLTGVDDSGIRAPSSSNRRPTRRISCRNFLRRDAR